jgi:CBS domain-containing protein
VRHDETDPGLDAGNRLEQIASGLKNGEGVEPITVRELLRWFGAKRRGVRVTHSIGHALEAKDLRTEPYFEDAFLDGLIEFRLGRAHRYKTFSEIFNIAEMLDREELSSPSDEEEHGTAVTSHGPLDASANVIAFPGRESIPRDLALITDPTFRVGRLPAANIRPTCVAPNSSIPETTTKMLLNGFSQLPVMNGERDVKGAISWRSIGVRRELGLSASEVRECMETPRIISADTSLLDAIGEIVRHEYVLVRAQNNSISGIVTTSDLSMQFRELSEPFLLLREIENHIRNLILKGKFEAQELRNASEGKDRGRPVNDVFDLNFGEYIRLLEQKELWSKTQLPLDRTVFIERLENIREIRNDVMHFDPDGITEEDLEILRKFTVFLQKLQP